MSNLFKSSALVVFLATFVLSGCSMMAAEKRQKEDMVKNTVECEYEDGKLLVRFTPDEVRVLMPDRTRVYLYKMPSSRGVMYTNGELELIGKGTSITFGTAGDPKPLTCTPYDPDKREDVKEDEKGLKEMIMY